MNSDRCPAAVLASINRMGLKGFEDVEILPTPCPERIHGSMSGTVDLGGLATERLVVSASELGSPQKQFAYDRR